MEITITSTDFILNLDGVAVRLWRGVTKSGIPCHVYVHRLCVADGDAYEFDKALLAKEAPKRISV